MQIYTNEMIKECKLKKNKFQKIINVVLSPIFILLTLISLFVLYKKFILKKQNIEVFGYKFYVVLTGSMQPSICPNDVVVIKKQKINNIKKDDVITFSKSGSATTVTHRVVDVISKEGEVFYKTKGDNNNAEDDELVLAENVEGKCVFKISKVGVILTSGLTGTSYILIVVFLILCYMRSSKKQDRIIERECARAQYNVYKYTDKEEVNETIV